MAEGAGWPAPAGGTSGITTEVPRVVEVTGDAYWVALAITAAIAVAAIGLLLAGYLRNRKPAI